MLSGEVKRDLKTRAHALKPVVLLGHQGLTSAVFKEIYIALAYHELIKIKLPQLEREQRQLLVAEILQETQAHLIQSMGRVVTIYKEKDHDLSASASAKKAKTNSGHSRTRSRN